MSLNDFESFALEAVNNKIILIVVAYFAGIFSKVYISAFNENLKSRSKIKETLPEIVALLSSIRNNFSTEKINISQVANVKPLLNNEENKILENTIDSINKWNAFPRYDGEIPAENLKNFFYSELRNQLDKLIIVIKNK